MLWNALCCEKVLVKALSDLLAMKHCAFIMVLWSIAGVAGEQVRRGLGCTVGMQTHIGQK